MATLIPEDGSGLATANSFATVAELDDLVSENPYAHFWADSVQKDTIAIRATRLICDDVAARGWRWQGYPITTTQALPFPRYGLWNREGFQIAATAVPDAVKRLQAEICEILAGEDITIPAVSGRQEQNVSMGRLSVSFARNIVGANPVVADWFYSSVFHFLDRSIRTIRA